MKANNKAKKAQLIKVDGTMEIITPANGTDFKLDELQKYVEGLIDIVYLPTDADYIIICNDEGLFDKKYNSVASVLCGLVLYGNIIICKNEMVKLKTRWLYFSKVLLKISQDVI